MSQTIIKSHDQYNATDALPTQISDLPSNPLVLFQTLFQRAQSSGVKEPEAMALSTVSKESMPSTRFVLCKRMDQDGIVWFTNYDSRKAQEIAANPVASVAFYWKEISMSVRMNGKVSRSSSQESDEYFQSRPVGSRVGAWASPQSQIIPDRQTINVKVAEIEDRFSIAAGSADRTTPTEQDKQAKVDLPPHWGGYRLVPTEVEFWAGRPNRLHDRYRYLLQQDQRWTIDRLAP